jgi:hypothetical protein
MYPIIPSELVPGVVQAVVYFFTVVGILFGIGFSARA